jgi:hypothetical protein
MKKIRAEYALHVTADFAQARADIDRFREEQQRHGIGIGVDMALARAKADMDAFRARQESNDVTVKVKTKTDTSDLDKFLKKLGDLPAGPGGNALQFGGALALVGELPAATTAVAQFAGALQQLAGAGLAVPGILAGIGASVGTLVLGLSGISDAYTAVTKASQDSAQNQAQNAQQAIAANNAHRNAVVDEAQAEKDRSRAVRDATQQLEDLNLQLRGGQISEAQAANNALRQRRDLQKDLATGQIKDQIDLQGRLLDIQSADQSVADAHQRNIELQAKANDENAKGVTNSDLVVAANQRVTRSLETVQSTQAALDQQAQGSTSQRAAAFALSQLSANGQELVKTLAELRPQFQAFQGSIQDNLLAGVSQSIKSLVAADLPNLKTGMGNIATAWNGILKQLGMSLSSDSSKGFLDHILGNTADAQNRLKAAVDPIVHVLGVLSAAGSNTLPRLVDDFDKLADRFDKFISAADKDGRLDKWINDGITGFEQVGNILLNLGKSFTDITRAAGGGEGLWGTIEKATGKLHEFLSSTEGQNKLKQWFAEGRDEINNHIIPLLQALPGLFKGIVDAGTQIADVVVPPLRDISKFLGEHPKLIQDIVIAFAAWKTIAGVSSLIGDLEKISGLLGIAGTGKGGKGGKGILGKIGLISIAGVALNALLDDSSTPPAPPGAPPSDQGLPSGQVPTGQLPAGQATPFGQVPVLPPKDVASVVAGAAVGAVTGGPAGAAAGAFAAEPGVSPSNLPQAQKDLQTLLQAIPQLNDDNLKPIADALGVSVGDLRKMPRDELIKRYNAAIATGAPPPAQDPTHGLLTPPGFTTGGVLPGYSPGKDNLLGVVNGNAIKLAGGEGIIRPEVVRKIGPAAIHALNGFAGGAVIDQFGNPVDPGMLLGPSTPMPDPSAPIAPNPSGGGALPAIQTAIGGLQGPLSGLVSGAVNGSGIPGLSSIPGLGGIPGATPGAAGLTPGLAGLAQAGNNPNAQAAWQSQTASYLGNWGGQLLAGLGSAFYTGILGFFGLGNSILSPSNPWFQDATKSLGGLGALGLGGTPGGTPALGTQTITLGDGSTVQIPTFGTSTGVPGVPGAPRAVAPSGPGSQAAINAANQLAGKPYIAGGHIGPDGTDCSGLVSWVVNAYTGNPGSTNRTATPTEGPWLAAKGAVIVTDPSQIPPGVLAIGWNASHTAGTLPNGNNFESSTPGAPIVVGPNASGYRSKQFTNWAYFPAAASAPANVSVPGQDAQQPFKPSDVPPTSLQPSAFLGAGTPDAAGEYANPPYQGGKDWTWDPATTRWKPPAAPATVHDVGGWHMPDELSLNLTKKPEAVLTPDESKAHIQLAQAAVAQQKQPRPQVPDAHLMQPPPAPAQVAPTPAQQEPQAAPPPPAQVAPTGGPAPIGAGATSDDHLLPAVSTGIQSGFAAAGNAVSAIAGALSGGAGGGGGLIQGGFAQLGKIATGFANVGASMLVGSVPGSFGDPNLPAGGATLRPPQMTPHTAPLGNNYIFNGIESEKVVDELRLKDAQDQQALLATSRG